MTDAEVMTLLREHESLMNIALYRRPNTPEENARMVEIETLFGLVEPTS